MCGKSFDGRTFEVKLIENTPGSEMPIDLVKKDFEMTFTELDGLMRCSVKNKESMPHKSTQWFTFVAGPSRFGEIKPTYYGFIIDEHILKMRIEMSRDDKADGIKCVVGSKAWPMYKPDDEVYTVTHQDGYWHADPK